MARARTSSLQVLLNFFSPLRFIAPRENIGRTLTEGSLGVSSTTLNCNDCWDESAIKQVLVISLNVIHLVKVYIYTNTHIFEMLWISKFGKITFLQSEFYIWYLNFPKNIGTICYILRIFNIQYPKSKYLFIALSL